MKQMTDLTLGQNYHKLALKPKLFRTGKPAPQVSQNCIPQGT